MKPSSEDKPRPSPLTRAHTVLYGLQEQKGRYLTYDEVTRKLGSTSGLLFSPGTTVDDILDKLEEYDLIAGDKLEGRIFVKKFISTPEPRTWKSRQEYIREKGE